MQISSWGNGAGYGKYVSFLDLGGLDVTSRSRRRTYELCVDGSNWEDQTNAKENLISTDCVSVAYDQFRTLPQSLNEHEYRSEAWSLAGCPSVSSNTLRISGTFNQSSVESSYGLREEGEEVGAPKKCSRFSNPDGLSRGQFLSRSNPPKLVEDNNCLPSPARTARHLLHFVLLIVDSGWHNIDHRVRCSVLSTQDTQCVHGKRTVLSLIPIRCCLGILLPQKSPHRNFLARHGIKSFPSRVPISTCRHCPGPHARLRPSWL